MTRLYNILNKMLERTKKVDITSEMTVRRSSGGTVSDTAAQRVGQFILLQFRVTNTTAVASGGNFFVGYISNNKPPGTLYSCAYQNQNPVICSLATDGTIVCRNTSPNTVTLSAGAGVSFIYVLDN